MKKVEVLGGEGATSIPIDGQQGYVQPNLVSFLPLGTAYVTYLYLSNLLG